MKAVTIAHYYHQLWVYFKFASHRSTTDNYKAWHWAWTSSIGLIWYSYVQKDKLFIVHVHVAWILESMYSIAFCFTNTRPNLLVIYSKIRLKFRHCNSIGSWTLKLRRKLRTWLHEAFSLDYTFSPQQSPHVATEFWQNHYWHFRAMYLADMVRCFCRYACRA